MGNDLDRASVEALASDVSAATIRMSRKLRAKHDSSVSMPQISALVALALSGPMTPGALAQYEQVKPPSMTRVLGLLEDAGLIGRTKHPTDGRQVLVEISATGREVLSAEGSRRKEWLASRIQRLSIDQQTSLREAVQILLEWADEKPGPPRPPIVATRE